MNISTAYPNYTSRMKSAEAAAAAAEAAGGGRHHGGGGRGEGGIPRDEDGKYDWHTVVDGLSKFIKFRNSNNCDATDRWVLAKWADRSGPVIN